MDLNGDLKKLYFSILWHNNNFILFVDSNLMFYMIQCLEIKRFKNAWVGAITEKENKDEQKKKTT